MTQLFIASLVFLCLHLGISATPLRDRAIGMLGASGYRAAFSILALLSLIWLVVAFRAAPYVDTWGQLRWFKHLAVTLMIPAFLLVVLGLLTPNPTAVGGEKLLQGDSPVRGILRVTRHPFLWGVTLWALLHLIANGDLAALVFFGSLLILPLVGMISIDAKRRKEQGDAWEIYAQQTSRLPFAALRAGRNRMVWKEFRWWQVLLALFLFAGMLHMHLRLFGVSPLS
jgi:uncharacterized membrane protein